LADRADSIALADSRGVDRVMKKSSRQPRKWKVYARKPAKRPSVERSSSQSNIRSKIEAAIRSIPGGKVSTYGGVARAAGFPGGARLVARVLQRGFELPWQRVLGAGGEIKLRGDSAIEQRLRLEAEGVRFRGRKVDMKTCEWKFGRARLLKRR
jgi:alkylated DNA nucleotide flippase Atl1